MKYCIDFLQECYPILDKVDEINIKYNRKNTHILDFVNEHKNQTINVVKKRGDFFENKKQITTNNSFSNNNYCAHKHLCLFKLRNSIRRNNRNRSKF